MNLTREQRLIDLIKQITGENLIGDDCALLKGQTLVSSDMLVEGKHFLLPQISYDDLGWKAMAVNLSDIAAMAGTPEFAVVNIAMPPNLSDVEFRRLYASMTECARSHGTRIVGGDLTGSSMLVISITVLGKPPASGDFLRASASPGYVVIVSGDFGASSLGLELILRGEMADAKNSYALRRHLRPEPRFDQARLLADAVGGLPAARQQIGRVAMMDASDGLADALLQIASASKVSISIDELKVPIHPEVKQRAAQLGLNLTELALYGGEDYELVACVHPDLWREIETQSGNDFRQIGCVKLGDEVVLIDAADKSIRIESNKTFQHWK